MSHPDATTIELRLDRASLFGQREDAEARHPGSTSCTFLLEYGDVHVVAVDGRLEGEVERLRLGPVGTHHGRERPVATPLSQLAAHHRCRHTPLVEDLRDGAVLTQAHLPRVEAVHVFDAGGHSRRHQLVEAVVQAGEVVGLEGANRNHDLAFAIACARL